MPWHRGQTALRYTQETQTVAVAMFKSRIFTLDRTTPAVFSVLKIDSKRFPGWRVSLRKYPLNLIRIMPAQGENEQSATQAAEAVSPGKWLFSYAKEQKHAELRCQSRTQSGGR